MAPAVRSVASRSRGCHTGASIAQMVERKTLNLVVVGSIPTGGALFWPALSSASQQDIGAGIKALNNSRFSSVGRASD